MNSEILKEFENKKVKITLRNQKILQGYLILQGKAVLIKEKDSKKCAILPQEITQIEEVD